MLIGTIKQYLYPIVGVVVLIILGFAIYKIDNFGYNRGKSETTAKYETILSEVNSKNSELLKKLTDEHNAWVEKQDKAINELKEDNNRLEKIQKENELEASEDNNAKRPAVGKPSVLRLNRVR